jgi:nucleoside-diphosphate-sugar epimerase
VKIAVTGATGTQGGAVAALLATHGHEVRRVTRNPKHPNDVHGDFDDPPSLGSRSSVDQTTATGVRRRRLLMVDRMVGTISSAKQSR